MLQKYYVESLDQLVSPDETDVVKMTVTKRVHQHLVTMDDIEVRVFKPTKEAVFDRYLDTKMMNRFFEQYAEMTK